MTGIEFTQETPDEVVAKILLKPEFMAPNGFLHAGLVVTLADTVVLPPKSGPPASMEN